MNKYNFLWIDDEWEAQGGFIDEAIQLGVKIIARNTSREGMEYLEENLNEVDAVILDAKVFDQSEDEVPSVKGLHNSINTINKLSGKYNQDVPYAIYTGQPDLMDQATFEDSLNGKRIFSKLKNGDRRALINYLRDAAKSSPEATIRNRYSAVYAACMDGQYGRYGKRIWDYLRVPFRSIENSTQVSDGPYNDIRKALECVMWVLTEKGYIPKELSEKKTISPQMVSLFLSQEQVTLEAEKLKIFRSGKILPVILEQNLRLLTQVVAPGSHVEKLLEGDRIKEVGKGIQSVSAGVKDHHLVEICTLLICDLIVWINSFLDEYPNGKHSFSYSVLKEEVECVQCKVIKLEGIFVIAEPVEDTPGIGLTRFSIRKNLSPQGLKEGDLVDASSEKIIKTKGSFVRMGSGCELVKIK
ncbi:hypothetical protein N9F41_00170 [bacterium]|nr:hypothetical protein [bacterium]MDB4781139.1 hypothetical protein [Akkermansiaceae bacterium]